MPWDPTKPAGSDAANTIDNTTQPNFSALDTWASAITDGVSAGTAAVVKAYRAANAVIAKFRAAGGDTDDRFRYDLNGQLEWGSGSAAPDVVLSRSAANVLRLASGDAIRSQTDPANAEDLVRKSYVDLLDRAMGDVTVANTTTETSVYSFSISGNKLGTVGGVRLVVSGTASTLNLINELTIRVKLGATTIFTFNTNNNESTSPGTQRAIKFVVELFNTATNAQRVHFHGFWRDASVPLGAWDAYGTAAEDTTTAKTLDVTVQWASASANNDFRKKMAFLEFFS